MSNITNITITLTVPTASTPASKHGDHVDYLHDGHLHHVRDDGKVEEHVVEVSDANPDTCTPAHSCGCHPSDHVHGPGLRS